MRNCLTVTGVILAVFLIIYIVLGGGEEPLSLIVEPQRDALIHTPDVLKLLDTTTGIMARTGMLDEEEQKNVAQYRSGKYRGAARLFFPKLEAALAIDVPTEPDTAGSGIIALQYGRTGKVLTRIFAGGKNPYQENPGEPRFWRFGTTGAIQWGETYDIVPKHGEDPFSDMGEEGGRYLAAALLYPERIAGRLGSSPANDLDAMRVPWPITEIKLVLDGDEEKGFGIHGEGKFRQDKIQGLTGKALEAGAMPCLAGRFINDDTVLAAGWLAPEAAEVAKMMTEFAPSDGTLRNNYHISVGRFRSELKELAGPRAALLIYKQRDVRMKPGYAGILFVQELARPEELEERLPDLLGSISQGVFEAGDIPPASYPYFVHKEPAKGLPRSYVYFTDMMRPAEGYQPVILVHDGMLIYASSPGTLTQALGAGGGKGDKVLSKMSYSNTDESGWVQIERVYKYLIAEMQAAKTGADTLTDETDYEELFKQAKSFLVQFDSIELSTTGDETGSYAVDVKLFPKISK